MSITGFNRRRRELARIEALNKEAIEETIEEDKIDYSKLKVDELKEIAKEKGIEDYQELKKVELIEAIEKV